MSTGNGARRDRRRRRSSQDGSADKVVVNLDTSSPAAGRLHGVSTSLGARTLPIDVEALEDVVQAVSPSQVPPPRRNLRIWMPPVTIVDLEIESGRFRYDNATVPAHNSGNKRRRIATVIHLSPERGEGSSLQPNNAVKPSEEPAKVAPKEANFTCPVCLNKLNEPSTTICGHIFCTECISQAIQIQKKCPTCRKALKKNNFHRVYLPNTEV